uniref:MAPK activated protein kinase 3 n=1 Tax=Xiphophorus couchianus TaxID=32473 RepID=A0A3B5MPQ8_9TELE
MSLFLICLAMPPPPPGDRQPPRNAVTDDYKISTQVLDRGEVPRWSGNRGGPPAVPRVFVLKDVKLTGKIKILLDNFISQENIASETLFKPTTSLKNNKSKNTFKMNINYLHFCLIRSKSEAPSGPPGLQGPHKC